MGDVLQQAGFRGQQLAVARAVMRAESGGRAMAHNPNAATGDDSYGLFQINMLGAMGPERRQQYGLKSNEDLYDPLTNAKIAYQMSKGGQDWSPWSTYKSGAYKQYLGKGGSVTPGVNGRVSSRDLASAAVSGGMGGPQGANPRNALLSMLSQNLSSYAQTGTMGTQTIDPSMFQPALQAPATPRAQVIKQAALHGSLPPMGASHGLVNIPGTGYQANAQILPQVESISKMFGVKVNSAYRDPQHNKAVGGATHSDHLSGNAIDFVGTPAQMRRLYQWAQGKFPYVEPWGQAGGNHVHISFIR